jgi:uncharacterized protein YjiS (DUF1127 family)
MAAMHFHPFSTMRQWRRRAQDRRELATMSDLMLQDIGITRADAEFLATKPFWKE